MNWEKIVLNLNIFLVFILSTTLIIHSTDSHFDPQNYFLISLGLISTIPVITSAAKSIFKHHIGVDLLASIALVVSIIEFQWYSVVFINLMITSARIFGIYTQSKAKKTIQSLLKLRPQKAKIEKNGQIHLIDVNQIKINDLVIVDAGDRIPIDGIIQTGAASIDQSTLTGESLPVEKKAGDQILSSTLNLSGSLLVKTSKIGKDTTFEKLISLMEEAQSKKIKIETLIDKFTSKYIFFTLIGAILIFIFTKNISIVLSVLLVTCADDIAVAVPLAFWAAIARAAKNGIVIKGGNYLEALAKCRILIVDKTGTLTKGKIKVDHLVSFGISEKKLLSLAATAESVSDHPLAHAVIEYALKNQIDYSPPQDFDELPGKGMKVKLHHQNILAGNLNFFKNEKIKISPDQLKEINAAENDGHNIILIAANQKFLGFIALGDEIRFGIRSSLQKLKQMGIVRIVMITGDNEKVAKTVANQLGIEEYHANFLPQDKLNFIQKNLNPRYKIAMVGDGVNDSAALAMADIGFAMGAIGSDSAIQAADIALMNDDFSKISDSVKLSRFIFKIIAQNFIIWGIVNIIGLILVFTQIIGPTGSAAYNFFSDFLPLLNSMRLFGYNFQNNNLSLSLKKIIGVILIILGLILHLIPLFPASWIVVLGLELAGLRILITKKFKHLFNKSPKP